MKAVRNLSCEARLMRLDTVRGSDASAPARSCGGALRATNVRRRQPEGLWPVGEPELLDTLTGTPLAADSRDGLRHIITFDSELHLRHEMVVWPGGRTRRINRDLCQLPARPASCAAAGDFLILRLIDGRLFYLLWESDLQAYSVLGTLPAMPRISASRTAAVEMSATVAETKFPAPVEDPRAASATSWGTRPGEAVKSAWESLLDKAAATGCWTRPVAVRAVWRLWDGSVLYISEPVAAGTLAAPAPGRVALPMTAGDKGLTGTAAGSVSVSAFRIAVSLADTIPGAWARVVSHIELWTSREPALLDESREPQAAYFQSGSAPMLGVTLPVRGDAEMTAALTGAQMELALRVPFSGGRREFTLTRPALPTPGTPSLEARTPLGRRAAALLGHGGFLHVAAGASSSPAPPVPVAGTASGQTLCRVSVTLTDPSGAVRHAGAETSVADSGGKLRPLLWYPSARATSMRIGLRAPDGTCREAEFSLSPPAGGEDAAFYAEAGADAIELPVVEELTPLPSEAVSAGAATAVLTMRRGNPFVEAGATLSAGATVRFLAALPSGGGAYTRQYIYLFTDRGIFALTHDSDGRHRNLRPVSAVDVSEPQRVTSTPEAVMALADSGELLSLRDSRCRTLARGLTAYGALCHHRRHNELWLLPARTGAYSLALDLDSGDVPADCSFRTTAPKKILADGDDPLFTDADGSLCLLEGAGAAPLPAEWESWPVTAASLRPAIFTLRITGNPVEGAGSVWARTGPMGIEAVTPAPLGQWTMNCPCAGTCRFGLMLPPDGTALTVRFSGRFEALAGFTVAPAPVPR